MSLLDSILEQIINEAISAAPIQKEFKNYNSENQNEMSDKATLVVIKSEFIDECEADESLLQKKIPTECCKKKKTPTNISSHTSDPFCNTKSSWRNLYPIL